MQKFWTIKKVLFSNCNHCLIMTQGIIDMIFITPYSLVHRHLKAQKSPKHKKKSNQDNDTYRLTDLERRRDP
jgi:hypothetical protein